MHERSFDLEDLSRVRFAVSPIWELVTSLRVLGAERRGGMHERWSRATRDVLRRERIDASRLLALAPPSGHVADFLTPSPAGRSADVEAELDQIGRTPPSVIRRDLTILRPAGGPVRPLLEDGLHDPTTFVARVVTELRSYWKTVLEPAWPRLRGLAEADVAWRLERIADRGPRTALATLHPRVRIEDDRLVVRGTCTAPEPAPPGSGVVLVPCAFAWPEILLLDTPVQEATLAYAPRGIANLWQETPPDTDALSSLIGHTRASLLQMLDLPTTTVQLAAQLQLTPPTTNAHLHILHRAGAVSRRRQGRRVLYTRTPLGDSLLAGHALRDG